MRKIGAKGPRTEMGHVQPQIPGIARVRIALMNYSQRSLSSSGTGRRSEAPRASVDRKGTWPIPAPSCF